MLLTPQLFKKVLKEKILQFQMRISIRNGSVLSKQSFCHFTRQLVTLGAVTFMSDEVVLLQVYTHIYIYIYGILFQ